MLDAVPSVSSLRATANGGERLHLSLCGASQASNEHRPSSITNLVQQQLSIMFQVQTQARARLERIRSDEMDEQAAQLASGHVAAAAAAATAELHQAAVAVAEPAAQGVPQAVESNGHAAPTPETGSGASRGAQDAQPAAQAHSSDAAAAAGTAVQADADSGPSAEAAAGGDGGVADGAAAADSSANGEAAARQSAGADAAAVDSSATGSSVAEAPEAGHLHAAAAKAESNGVTVNMRETSKSTYLCYLFRVPGLPEQCKARQHTCLPQQASWHCSADVELACAFEAMPTKSSRCPIESWILDPLRAGEGHMIGRHWVLVLFCCAQARSI